MKKKVLECISLSKSLNRKSILSDFSLCVYEREVVGIAGPVGAGKTTLLYLILGLISSDKGNINIFSQQMNGENRNNILQRTNFASSSLKLAGYSTVWENLITFANLYQIKNPREKINELISVFKISHLIESKRKLFNLSAGELTKVMLCKSLLNDPDLLLLDEITAHLDPPSIDDLQVFIKKYVQRKGKSILWVSHNYDDVQKFCTKLIVIKNRMGIHFDSIPTESKFKKLYV